MTGDLAYLYKALHDMFPDSTDNRPVTIAELDAVFKTAESLKINDMAAEKKVSKSGEGHRSLKDGSTVSFDRGQGPKGEQAVNVKSA